MAASVSSGKKPKVDIYMWSKDNGLHREIQLRESAPMCQIGRVSKNSDYWRPAKENGWIESPIISRLHAEFRMGETTDKASSLVLLCPPLFLLDTNSTHGTYVNEKRLEPKKPYVVDVGDEVRFGISVTTSGTTFEAKRFKVVFRQRNFPDEISSNKAPDNQQEIPDSPKAGESGYAVGDITDSDIEELPARPGQHAPSVESVAPPRPRETSLELVSAQPVGNNEVVFVSENKAPSSPSGHADAEKPSQGSPELELRSPVPEGDTAAVQDQVNDDGGEENCPSDSSDEEPDELPIVSSPASVRKRGKSPRAYTLVGVDRDAAVENDMARDEDVTMSNMDKDAMYSRIGELNSRIDELNSGNDELRKQIAEDPHSDHESQLEDPHSSKRESIDEYLHEERAPRTPSRGPQAADSHTYTIDDVIEDSEEDSDYAPEDKVDHASVLSPSTSSSVSRVDSHDASEDDSEDASEDSEDERALIDLVGRAAASRSNQHGYRNKAIPKDLDDHPIYEAVNMEVVPGASEGVHGGHNDARAGDVSAEDPTIETNAHQDHEQPPVLERGSGRHESEPPSLHSSPAVPFSNYSPSDAFERSSVMHSIIDDLDANLDIDDIDALSAKLSQGSYSRREPVAPVAPAHNPIESTEPAAALEQVDNGANHSMSRSAHKKHAFGAENSEQQPHLREQSGQAHARYASNSHLPTVPFSVDRQHYPVCGAEPSRTHGMLLDWTTQGPLSYGSLETQQPPPAPVPPHRSLPYDAFIRAQPRLDVSSEGVLELSRVPNPTSQVSQHNEYADGPFREHRSLAPSSSFGGHAFWVPGREYLPDTQVDPQRNSGRDDLPDTQIDPRPEFGSSFQSPQSRHTPGVSRVTRISDIVNEAPAPAMSRSVSHQSREGPAKKDGCNGSCYQCEAAGVRCSSMTKSGEVDCDRCQQYDFDCYYPQAYAGKRSVDAAFEVRAAEYARPIGRPSTRKCTSSTNERYASPRGTKRKADNSESRHFDINKAAKDQRDFWYPEEVREWRNEAMQSRAVTDEWSQVNATYGNADGPSQADIRDAMLRADLSKPLQRTSSEVALMPRPSELFSTMAEYGSALLQTDRANSTAREPSADAGSVAQDPIAENANSTNQSIVESTDVPILGSSLGQDAQPREEPTSVSTSTELHETEAPSGVVASASDEEASFEQPLAKRLCTIENRDGSHAAQDPAQRERDVATSHQANDGLTESQKKRRAKSVATLRGYRTRKAKDAARKAARSRFRSFVSGCLVGAATLGAAAAALIATVPDSVMQEAAKSF